ncbi:MAG: hypothetical protein L0154_09935 [Chloroflexi bacterium]|nr:hypothetical protein [Chloroflexota bacterium]
MTLSEVLRAAQQLSIQERKELVKRLVDTLDLPAIVPQKRRLSELRGLGKELWQGVDAQEYVNQLRDEWDNNS